MKMEDAMKIISGKTKEGYMVHFEKKEGSVLRSDYFPEVGSGEEPIPTEREAWLLAELFASKTVGKCVDIYVIRREDFTPVIGYKSRMIINRS